MHVFYHTILKVNVKVKFTIEQATKAQSGSRVIDLFFFNLGARWGGCSTPRPGRFTPGKETRYPLYRRLSGPQGRYGQVRKISPHTGIRSPDRPARSELLYQLSYPGPLSDYSFHNYTNTCICTGCFRGDLPCFRRVFLRCTYYDGNRKVCI